MKCFKNKKPCLIGFYQSLGIVIYAALVSGVFELLATISEKAPRFYGPAFVVLLIIFSAAVSGSIVFGYPAYLALNKKWKEALTILGYTFVYTLGIIILIIILMAIFT